MSSGLISVACIGWCGGYGLGALSNKYSLLLNEKYAKAYNIAAKVVGYGSAIYVVIESIINIIKQK